MLEQLIEETRDLYDGSAFLVGAFGETPAKELVANVHYRRAFLLSTPKSTLFWTRVELHAYVVMPNHVHLLITPRISVSRLLNSLKAITAKRANLSSGLLEKLSGRMRAMIVWF